MNRPHLIINLLCFITVIISLSFGMSIFNVFDNQHITHFSNFESQSFYTIDDVSVLTAKAVIFTSVFVLAAFGVQIYSYFKTQIPRRRKIILGLLPLYLIIFGFSTYLMLHYATEDFYSYGFVWILLSLCLIFGNTILLFIKK